MASSGRRKVVPTSERMTAAHAKHVRPTAQRGIRVVIPDYQTVMPQD